MDVQALKLYLQNVEEYVMDEDKIVTYKWLSKNLGIHVNTAKQLLYTFATEQKNNVHITYLVGGFLSDGTGCKIQIVPEEDLIRVKAKFKTLTSEHVYSVQKTKALPDLAILYAVDKHERDKNDICKRLSAITCSNSVLRPQEEIDRLRLQARSATCAADRKEWSKGPPANKKTAEAPSNKEAATADASKVDRGSKKGLKNGGIAAMFAAQTSQIKQQDGMDKKPRAAQKSTAESKATSGIGMFFSRDTEKPVKPMMSVAKGTQNGERSPPGAYGNTVEENCTSRSHQERQDLPNKKTELSDIVKNNSIKHTGKRVGSAKSQKMSTSKKLLPAKRLKRIVVLMDSEGSSDDDMFNRDDGDTPDSPPPPEIAPKHHESDGDDVIPPTPESELKKGRKRVRTMKDKTFMDEDGYLHFHMEYGG
jgi:DNA polymerase delta subunit 3